MMTADDMKRLDFVTLVSRWYGLSFSRCGNEWQGLSPFTGERDPSLFVRLVEGHWLFKDFSSGLGGSLIDFVQHVENLLTVSEAMRLIRDRVEGGVGAVAIPPKKVSAVPSYDLEEVYAKSRSRNLADCLTWLRGRGLGATQLEELVNRGLLLLNQAHGKSYCCFVVRDEQAHLRCLDNHEIGGLDKFVLGRKYPFSLDYPAVLSADQVYVTEGIIDYLSMKELEGHDLVGVALLGNIVRRDCQVLDGSSRLVSALDDDAGGVSGFLDLGERYPEKEIEVYDLEGSKDPNELLQKTRTGKRTDLSADRKVALVREFHASGNKSEVARKWGVDRSYLYDLVREADAILAETYGRRHRGRKPVKQPVTVEEAWERITELEEALDKKDYDYQHAYAESAMLKVRLKWSEIEVSELKGEGEDPSKRQIKKKKKKSSS